MSEWTELRNDFYDDIEKCWNIDAWNTLDDNEEREVIAKVYENGLVEYLDERAKTNEHCQELIKEIKDNLPKHFYSVIQFLDTGKIKINKWNIIKETNKTITYSSLDGYGSYTKNKSSFGQVHLDYKDDYTERSQKAYVFAGACNSPIEAFKIAEPIFLGAGKFV